MCACHLAALGPPVLEGFQEMGGQDGEAFQRNPLRWPLRGAGASAASGAASRLRVRSTMTPTALHHMIVSLRQLPADLLPAIRMKPNARRELLLEAGAQRTL